MGRRDREPSCVLCSLQFGFKDAMNPVGARCPLLLKCGHSACEGCIRSLSRGGSFVKCTICATVSEANKFKNPEELRGQFPLNTFGVGQVVLKRTMYKKSGDSAIGFFEPNRKMGAGVALCSECKNEAVCKCQDCKLQFCSQCFEKLHTMFKSFQSHQKLPLADIPSSTSVRTITCDKHLGEMYEFFCNGCNIYICKNCCFESHLEHSCINVAVKNQEFAEEFLKLYDEAKTVLRQLYSTRKKLQNAALAIQDQEALQVEKRVTSHFSQLHGILQQKEDEILKKIKLAQDNTHYSLATIAHEIDMNIKEKEAILKESKSALEPNDSVTIPFFYLIENLQNVKETPCHLVLNDDEETPHFGFAAEENIIEVLKNHCTVTTPSKRVYELRSSSNLPDNYEVEDISDVPDPLDKILAEPFNSKIVISSPPRKESAQLIHLPPAEMKTKPSSFQVLNKQRQSITKKEMDTCSIASSDSDFEALCNLPPLREGSTEIVTICHLITPNNFYVQRKASQVQIESLREQFTKRMRKKSDQQVKVILGQMYLVLYSGDKKWYRAVVEKIIDQTKCKVLYVDYGNTEEVNVSKLREIPEKYIKLPGQAINCSLYNCLPVNGEWSAAALKHMASMSHNVELSMNVVRIWPSCNKFDVYLRSLNSSNTFQESLVFLHCAAVCESECQMGGLFRQLPHPTKLASFKEITVNKGDTLTVQVTHVNTPTNFYAQQITRGASSTIELLADLTQTYSRLGPNDWLIYNPVVGMAVAAKFSDGSWSRAKVLEIPAPLQVVVQFVDFGNVSTVVWENIRTLDARFLKVGVLGIRCSLNDVASKQSRGWTTNAKKAFENMVLKKMLQLFVDEIDENVFYVTLYDKKQKNKHICINGLLVQKGHAVSTGPSSSKAEFLSAGNSSEKDYLSTSSDNLSSVSRTVDRPSALYLTTENLNRECPFPELSSDYVESPASLKSNVCERSTSEQKDDENRVRIKIVKLVSPDEVYVTFDNILNQVTKLVEDMTLFYEQSKEEDRTWEVDDFCAVYRKTDNKWYRGVIENITDERYKVFIKDIVEKIIAEKSALRTLEPRFIKVMDGTVLCHLSGLIAPGGTKNWPSLSLNYLQTLIEVNSDFYIKVLGSGKSLPVQLWVKRIKVSGPLDPVNEVWEDVNKGLIHQGLALPDRSVVYSATDRVDVRADSAAKLDITEEEEENLTRISEWVQKSFDRLDGDDDLLLPPIDNKEETKQSNTSEKSVVTSERLLNKEDEIARDWAPAKPFKQLDFVCNPSYVDNECAIYIQDLNESYNNLEFIQGTLSSVYEGTLPKPHDLEWSKGQICIAHYDLDNNWYRAKVLDVTPEHVEIIFVDYGNVETVQPEKLRKNISQFLIEIPVHCHRCITKGLIPVSKNGKWPTKTLDYVHLLTVEKQCRVNLKPPTPDCNEYVILNLFIPGGQDLLSILVSMDFATFVLDCDEVAKQLEAEDNRLLTFVDEGVIQENHQIVRPTAKKLEQPHPVNTSTAVIQPSRKHKVLDSQMKYKNLLLPDLLVELKVEVEIVNLLVSARVTVVECDDPEVMSQRSEFSLIQQEIGENIKNLPMVLNPVPGLPCVGCFTEDNVWYRAEVLDVLQDEKLVKVQYVDYGNEENIPVERLRQTKEKWMKLPKQAFNITFHAVELNPNIDRKECHKLLIQCLSNPPYIMTIEARQPRMEVELFTQEGELAYHALFEKGFFIKA